MTTQNTSISLASRLLLFLASCCVAITIFVPLWRIDLDAPQYPEGLRLIIYPDKLAGNVDIINGLNHYIGMKTLHTEDFREFTILPYILWGFVALLLITGIVARRRMLFATFFAFLAFGIIAMVDFYIWEYNYGHHLDPNAPIIVPGAAYQPPLIGFKQLLNFGAYSIPALGGWLFIAAGALLLLSVGIEKHWFKALTSSRQKHKPAVATLILAAGFLVSCGNSGPQPIQANKDNCDYCKMTIADVRYAAEIVTGKGRAYKFDDIVCMVNYMKENERAASALCYYTDYIGSNELMPATAAIIIKGDSIRTPMGGNMIAFKNKDSARLYADRFSASEVKPVPAP